MQIKESIIFCVFAYFFLYLGSVRFRLSFVETDVYLLFVVVSLVVNALQSIFLSK